VARPPDPTAGCTSGADIAEKEDGRDAHFGITKRLSRVYKPKIVEAIKSGRIGCGVKFKLYW
jgi:hypothetical protein